MTPDPRTEEIRARLAALHHDEAEFGGATAEDRFTRAAVGRMFDSDAPADLAYLLGRIEALEAVAEAVREAVDLRDETIATGGCEGVEWTADMSRRMAANLLRCRAALVALDGGEGE